MSTVEYCFIEPLDVLYLRGNKLFGDPGSFGESLIPPWPSVAAGAIRSRMLTDDGTDLAAFSLGKILHPTLGTPENPGSFTLNDFYLAMQCKKQSEILIAPPADLVISETEKGQPVVSAMKPQAVASQLLSSAVLPVLPVLAQGDNRSKPVGNYWLKQSGWQKYLNGELPTAEDLIHSQQLWAIDSRIGIGMNADTRSVEIGKLFSAQAVALQHGVGFVAGVCGAKPPQSGLLRFGGDGRAAAVTPANIRMPKPNYDAIYKSGRCRIVLTTPGLFQEGWRLPGSDCAHRFSFGQIHARLVSAAVQRAETISGWDLAKRQPKPAQRVAPTGCVYWLDDLRGNPEALRKLVETGLWLDPCEDSSRRAEGFNRIAIAAWTN